MARIYLDNAATSFPKPPGVMAAMVRFAEAVGASPGRGSYRESVEAGRLTSQCRERLCRLVNAPSAGHVVFTLNATDALNQAIKGLVRAALRRGSAHAVSTIAEHNSILRPLNALREEGLEWTCVACDGAGRVDPGEVIGAIRPDTVLVALGHGSNVTGALQEIEPVGAACRERGVAFVVDAAQTAGHVPIDVEAMGIDVLCVPGHKGLLGPLGTGAMIVRPGLESSLLPLREGGTGSVSELDMQPRGMPDRYESGSQNTIGIAGLGAGLAWILDRGVESVWADEERMAAAMRLRLGALDGVRVLGPERGLAVVSIVHESIDAHTLAMLLEQESGVLARAGLHCAPRMHEAMGTLAVGGSLRLSAGPFTTMEDIDAACGAIAELTAESCS